jgi:hypothetical protein
VTARNLETPLAVLRDVSPCALAMQRAGGWDVTIVETSGRAAEPAHRLRRELARYDLRARVVLVPPPAEPTPETFDKTRTSVVVMAHGRRRVAFLLFDRSRPTHVESGEFGDRQVEPLAKYIAARLGRTQSAIEVHIDTERWELLYGTAALQAELDRAWADPVSLRRLDLASNGCPSKTSLAVIQSGSGVAERPDLVEGIAWLLARPSLVEGMTHAEAAAAVDAYIRLHGSEPRAGVSVALWHAGEPALRTNVALDQALAERVLAQDSLAVEQFDRCTVVERILPAIVRAVVAYARGLDLPAMRKLMVTPDWRVGVS